MSFKVFKWSDADAPSFDTSKGSLIELLEKCLVTGYGSGEEETLPPDPAWSVEKSADGLHAVFWSNGTHPDATGHYFYVRDDGEVDGDPAGDDVLEHGREAYIQGALDFTGWTDGKPDLTDKFPQPGSMARGAVWEKRDDTGYSTNPSWVVIADSRTVYVTMGNYRDGGSDSANFADSSAAFAYGLRAFGDLRPLSDEPGGTSFISGGDTYNNTSNPAWGGGHILDRATHDGVVCSFNHGGGVGGQLRSYDETGDGYCYENRPARYPTDLTDLTPPLFELPYLKHIDGGEGMSAALMAMRGIKQPSLDFDGDDDECNYFFYTLVGLQQGDPLMAHIDMGGKSRFAIYSDSAGFNDTVCFFDLEDDS